MKVELVITLCSICKFCHCNLIKSALATYTDWLYTTIYSVRQFTGSLRIGSRRWIVSILQCWVRNYFFARRKSTILSIWKNPYPDDFQHTTDTEFVLKTDAEMYFLFSLHRRRWDWQLYHLLIWPMIVPVLLMSSEEYIFWEIMYFPVLYWDWLYCSHNSAWGNANLTSRREKLFNSWRNRRSLNRQTWQDSWGRLPGSSL